VISLTNDVSGLKDKLMASEEAREAASNQVGNMTQLVQRAPPYNDICIIERSQYL
jgi:hypothetical protein